VDAELRGYDGFHRYCILATHRDHGANQSIPHSRTMAAIRLSFMPRNRFFISVRSKFALIA